MANRFWVGGSGTWNTVLTANWSATSGGGGGASAPTTSDSVFFDRVGTYTVTVGGATQNCASFTVSAGVVTFGGAGSNSTTVRGALTWIAATAWTATGAITFTSISNATINPASVSIASSLRCNPGGGAILTFSNVVTTSSFILQNGTAMALGNSLSCASFAVPSNGSSIAFGTSNVILTSAVAATTILDITGTGLTTTGTGGFTRAMGATATISTPGVTSVTSAVNLTVTGNSALSFNTSGLKNLIFSGAGTAAVNGSVTLYGNLTLGTGGTYTSFTPTFAATGTLTSNAKTVSNTTLNASGGTLTLSGALTLSTTATFTLTAGTLALNGVNLSCGLFSSNNSNTRAITFGTNNIALTGTGTVLNMTVATNFTWTGTGGFTRTASATGTMAFDTAASTSANAPNLTITAGGSLTTFTSGSWFKTVTFIGASSSGTGSIRLIGDLVIPASGTFTGLGANFYTTSTFTPNANTLASVSVNSGAALTLAGALTVSGNAALLTGSTLTLGSFALACGTFTANDNTASRVLAFGASGSITCATTTGTVFDLGTASGLTTSGAKTVNISAPGVTVVAGSLSEANALDFFIGSAGGAGTFTFLSTAGETARTVNFSTSFAGTWSGGPGATIYGDFVTPSNVSAGALPTSATAITLGSTSVTTRVLSSLKTFNCPLTLNGVGGTWQVTTYALALATGKALTLLNGTFDANNLNVTAGTFQCTGPSSVIAILLGSGTWTITDSGAAWYFPPVNYTSLAVTAGTATISMTSASAKSFVGEGKTWPTLNNGGAGALYINGAAQTFDTLSNTVQPTTFTFTAGSTTTVTNFNVDGITGSKVSLGSATVGSQFTLSKASGSVTANDMIIQDSNATGGASWTALNSTDNGNNTGWVFAAGSLGRFFLLFR